MYMTNEKVWEDDIWVKHIFMDGSRFHVTCWTNNGAHCSEKNCIENAPSEIKQKAFLEGKSVHTFVEISYDRTNSSNTRTHSHYDKIDMKYEDFY